MMKFSFRNATIQIRVFAIFALKLKPQIEIQYFSKQVINPFNTHKKKVTVIDKTSYLLEYL